MPPDDLFLAMANWDPARGFAERIAAAWRGPVRALPVLTPVGEPMAARSDHWSSLRIDVPAVMLTDTAEFRNPHDHGSSDEPGTLDLRRMAEAVSTIRDVVETLAADPPAPTAATVDAPAETFAFENRGSADEAILIGTTGERHVFSPGSTLAVSIPSNGVIMLEGVARLSLGARVDRFKAGRTTPLVTVRVPGRPGRGMDTSGGSAEYERADEFALEVDTILMRSTGP